MESSRLYDRLNLAASLSVLVGLLLVAYEIRQNNILAEAEAVNAMQTGSQTLYMAGFETDIGELIAKSLNEPENLTEAEIYKLDGWLVAQTLLLDRRLEFEERGLGYQSGEYRLDLAWSIESSFDYYFNNRFGRAWYLENREWLDPLITEIWDRKMEEEMPDPENDYAKSLMRRLNQN